MDMIDKTKPGAASPILHDAGAAPTEAQESMSESNTEPIKNQKACTRSSLAEKLETLENKVVHGVKSAGTAAERMLNKVLGTVENATATVGQTITKVTSTIGGAVDSLKGRVASTEGTLKSTLHVVREHISLVCLVRRRPWFMMGGAVAVGYCLDHMLKPSARGPREFRSAQILSPTRLSVEGAELGRDKEAYSSDPPTAAAGRSETARDRLLRVLAPHVTDIRGLAVGSLLTLFRSVVTKSMTPAWSGLIANALDGVTRELGGKPRRS